MERKSLFSRSEDVCHSGKYRVQRPAWKPSKRITQVAGTHSFPTITCLHPDRISILPSTLPPGIWGFNGTYPFPAAKNTQKFPLGPFALPNRRGCRLTEELPSPVRCSRNASSLPCVLRFAIRKSFRRRRPEQDAMRNRFSLDSRNPLDIFLQLYPPLGLGPAFWAPRCFDVGRR